MQQASKHAPITAATFGARICVDGRRGELGRAHSIGDDPDPLRERDQYLSLCCIDPITHAGAQNKVFPARVRHAYSCIHCGQRHLEHSVQNDTGKVIKSEEGVVRVHGRQAHDPCVHDALVGHDAGCLVGVDDLDPIPKENVAQQREGGGEGRHRVVGCHWDDRTVVHLERPRQVPDPPPAWSIPVRDHDHPVSESDQVLRKAPYVILNSAEVGVEEIAHHGDAVLSGGHATGGASVATAAG
jgi:hypothetical protein